MLRRTLIAFGLLAVMVGPIASAQRAAQMQTSEAGAFTMAVSELRERALRLTVLNSLPEEARAEATALMDRARAAKASEQELMVARMEAYVAALEAGESPKVAQDLAAGKVAEQSANVTRERETLRNDVEAFVKAHPDLRVKLLQAGQFGPGEGAMFGAGRMFGGSGLEPDMGAMFGAGQMFGRGGQERDMGAMFGAGGFGPGAGPMFGGGGHESDMGGMFGRGAGPMAGADEFGMHRRNLQRGARQVPQLPECMREFSPPGLDLRTP